MFGVNYSNHASIKHDAMLFPGTKSATRKLYLTCIREWPIEEAITACQMILVAWIEHEERYQIPYGSPVTVPSRGSVMYYILTIPKPLRKKYPYTPRQLIGAHNAIVGHEHFPTEVFTTEPSAARFFKSRSKFKPMTEQKPNDAWKELRSGFERAQMKIDNYTFNRISAFIQSDQTKKDFQMVQKNTFMVVPGSNDDDEIERNFRARSFRVPVPAKGESRQVKDINQEMEDKQIMNYGVLGVQPAIRKDKQMWKSEQYWILHSWFPLIFGDSQVSLSTYLRGISRTFRIIAAAVDFAQKSKKTQVVVRIPDFTWLSPEIAGGPDPLYQNFRKKDRPAIQTTLNLEIARLLMGREWLTLLWVVKPSPENGGMGRSTVIELDKKLTKLTFDEDGMIRFGEKSQNTVIESYSKSHFNQDPFNNDQMDPTSYIGLNYDPNKTVILFRHWNPFTWINGARSETKGPSEPLVSRALVDWTSTNVDSDVFAGTKLGQQTENIAYAHNPHFIPIMFNRKRWIRADPV